jgi:putative transposase
MHKELYNSALANRKTQYQKFGNNVDYYQQQNSLPAFKEVWTDYKLLNASSLQATLKRVDLAYQRFFQGLGKYPRFKSIRHYSGWTYPDGRQGFKAHTTGVNGYLKLVDLDIEIQMRGKARVWGRQTTCTLVYRNNKWYASITVDVPNIQRELGTDAIGIDIGCKSALAITDGENHQLIEAPKFLRSSEIKINRLLNLSGGKERRTVNLKLRLLDDGKKQPTESGKLLGKLLTRDKTGFIKWQQKSLAVIASLLLKS